MSTEKLMKGKSSTVRGEAIYTSEKYGNDETGKGTQEKPYKTILTAVRHAGQVTSATIYVDAKIAGCGLKYEPVAKSQLKKIQKIYFHETNKNSDKEQREVEDAEKSITKFACIPDSWTDVDHKSFAP